jgi:hypothetical protein
MTYLIIDANGHILPEVSAAALGSEIVFDYVPGRSNLVPHVD